MSTGRLYRNGKWTYHPVLCIGHCKGDHTDCPYCAGTNRDAVPWTELFKIGVNMLRRTK